jgi:hypothetical protein
MVVVVVKASMIPLNSTVSLRVDDSAAEDEPRGNYYDLFSSRAINVSRRSRMLETARSWASRCFESLRIHKY